MTTRLSARPIRHDLSDNVNPWGAPPAAVAALRQSSSLDLSRYPTAQGDLLRAALASLHGVAADEVLAGCGSDDLIDAAFRALGGPGAVIAMMDPTFATARGFARTNRLEILGLPLDRQGVFDLGAVDAAEPKLIYLCSPNNPTGTPLDAGVVDTLLARTEATILLDGAYAEYATSFPFGRAARRERLIVLRTLSKAWGLAGLRVGYAIGDAAMIRLIAEARGPYRVSGPSERAAVAALRHDRQWMQDAVRRTTIVRSRFTSDLETLGFAPLPSAANFVCLPVADAEVTRSRLLRQGIAVRAFTQLRGIGDAIRIAIGTQIAMACVLSALAEEPR